MILLHPMRMSRIIVANEVIIAITSEFHFESSTLVLEVPYASTYI
jgi:hypothetical protein